MGALITFGGVLLDFDFDLLRELCHLLDAQLDGLDAAARECPDPVGFGIYDSADPVSGLGFAACQQYIGSIAARVDMPKNAAIECPPVHRSGYAVATLVNAAANHWKHSSEWSEPPSKRAVRTLDVLAGLDVDVQQPYLMVNALYEIVAPERPRFEKLLPFLTKWRDEVVPAKK